MERWIIYTAALALGISFCAWTSADAGGRRSGKRAQAAFVDEDGDGIDDGATRRHRHGGHGRLTAQLTEEQRTQLKEAVEALKEQGASKEEIHAAVSGLFEEFGIERPEHAGRFGAQLTEEQQAQLKETVAGLREEGKSREEIHAAVGELLTGFGVELPEDWDEMSGFGRRGRKGGFGAQLTEDQRTALKEAIDALKETGASREEIRAAIGEELEALGIERPERSKMRGHRFGKGRRGGWRRGPAPDADSDAGDAGSGDASDAQ